MSDEPLEPKWKILKRLEEAGLKELFRARQVALAKELAGKGKYAPTVLRAVFYDTYAEFIPLLNNAISTRDHQREEGRECGLGEAGEASRPDSCVPSEGSG